MKSFKEDLTEEEWGGKNTFWSRGRTKVTLDQLKKAIEHIPTVKTPTNTLSINPGWKPTSKLKPDMNYPILILNGKIIDGNHRLKYAKDFDIFYVSCKLFTTDDLPEEMQTVFN